MNRPYVGALKPEPLPVSAKALGWTFFLLLFLWPAKKKKVDPKTKHFDY
jgi:hypothetical protein